MIGDLDTEKVYLTEGGTERLDCSLPVRAHVYLSGWCKYVPEPAAGPGRVSAETDEMSVRGV